MVLHSVTIESKHRYTTFPKATLGWILPILAVFSSFSMADDTDLLFTSCTETVETTTVVPGTPETVEYTGVIPDVLFIIDNSTSMQLRGWFPTYKVGQYEPGPEAFMMMSDGVKAAINRYNEFLIAKGHNNRLAYMSMSWPHPTIPGDKNTPSNFRGLKIPQPLTTRSENYSH